MLPKYTITVTGGGRFFTGASLFSYMSLKCFWNWRTKYPYDCAQSSAWKRWMALQPLFVLLRQKEKSWDAGFWSRYLPTEQHISVWRNLSSHLYSNILLRTQINRCGSAWYLLPPFADFQHSGTLFLHVFFLWVYKLFWSPMGELSLLENTSLEWCLCASIRTWGGYFILAFISVLF